MIQQLALQAIDILGLKINIVDLAICADKDYIRQAGNNNKEDLWKT